METIHMYQPSTITLHINLSIYQYQLYFILTMAEPAKTPRLGAGITTTIIA